MPNIAFVNGKWSRLSAAKISIEDRGFQFGDGVYEVIRTYGEAVFGLKAHLARLKTSAEAIEISVPHKTSQLEKIIALGCRKCGFKDIVIYIQLTRGSASRSHPFPKKKKPTLVMTFRPYTPIQKTMREKGVSLISTPDIRWNNCHIKSLNLLPNVMAREQAKRSGAFEAIFIRDGKVTEGAASNLFAVFGKKVVTSPAGPYILSGITREIVIKVGKKEGFQHLEKELTYPDLFKADELFLTGTTVEILPVIALDKRGIGTGRPGEITQFLYRCFQRYVHKK